MFVCVHVRIGMHDTTACLFLDMPHHILALMFILLLYIVLTDIVKKKVSSFVQYIQC